MRQPTSVLIYPVALVNFEWKYLLFYRMPRPDLGLPSFWQGITGGLEGNESLDDAAQREFIEETGIFPSEIESIGFTCSIPLQEKWRHLYSEGIQEIIEHVFVTHLRRNQEPILSNEHDKSRWCTETEALKLLFYDGNKETLKRSANYLKTHNKAFPAERKKHAPAEKQRCA
jgi:dihydroneopterin triphosphate diphosphatase